MDEQHTVILQQPKEIPQASGIRGMGVLDSWNCLTDTAYTPKRDRTGRRIWWQKPP